MPTFPGMIGMAVARRTKANTARTSAVLTSRTGIPTNRTLASSTRNTETWLTTSAVARKNHRSRTTVSICVRNRAAASSHIATGGRPILPLMKETTRPAAAPIRRANPSVLRTSARTAINTTRTTAPKTAVERTPMFAS
jgi:hypothetical protein